MRNKQADYQHAVGDALARIVEEDKANAENEDEGEAEDMDDAESEDEDEDEDHPKFQGRWLNMNELQNTDKAVADAILQGRIKPPVALKEFGGRKFTLKVWDYDAARGMLDDLTPSKPPNKAANRPTTPSRPFRSIGRTSG